MLQRHAAQVQPAAAVVVLLRHNAVEPHGERAQARHACLPQSALHVLHILQEVLTNIARHSRARPITVDTGVADGSVAC
ncbi:signal transduction histidine kinase, nitrate/nitrite-specific [Acidovorax sp. MR-S7]|nr:signal transduction histidine kinase, nitrate/nitrite-specific [Acidovorax sp. MR-S7]